MKCILAQFVHNLSSTARRPIASLSSFSARRGKEKILNIGSPVVSLNSISSFIPYNDRYSSTICSNNVESHFYSRTHGDFSSLGVKPDLVASIRKLGIEVPSNLQSEGIPAILEGKSVVLSAETGSGKTLGYLLPVIQQMHRQNQELAALHTLPDGQKIKNLKKLSPQIRSLLALDDSFPWPERVHGLILCPNLHLCHQITSVIHSLRDSEGKPLASAAIVRSTAPPPTNAPDFIVGTPKGLVEFFKFARGGGYGWLYTEEGLQASFMHVILDESDFLFNGGLIDPVDELLRKLVRSERDRLAYRVAKETGLPGGFAAFANLPQVIRNAAFKGGVPLMLQYGFDPSRPFDLPTILVEPPSSPSTPLSSMLQLPPESPPHLLKNKRRGLPRDSDAYDPSADPFLASSSMSSSSPLSLTDASTASAPHPSSPNASPSSPPSSVMQFSPFSRLAEVRMSKEERERKAVLSVLQKDIFKDDKYLPPPPLAEGMMIPEAARFYGLEKLMTNEEEDGDAEKSNIDSPAYVDRETKRSKLEKKMKKKFGPYFSRQFIFATATLPVGLEKDVGTMIQRRFPNAIWVKSKNVHRLVPGVRHTWIEAEMDDEWAKQLVRAVRRRDKEWEEQAEWNGRKPEKDIGANDGGGCNGVQNDRKSDKVNDSETRDGNLSTQERALLDCVKSVEKGRDEGRIDGQDNISAKGNTIVATNDMGGVKEYRTLVFVNGEDSVEKVSRVFVRNRIRHVMFHRQMVSGSDKASLEAFLQDPQGVMVCTDAAGRGLDIPNVGHVIQAEFAPDTVKFLHRVGRTARAGAKGHVTSLYRLKDFALVRVLQHHISNNLPLDAAFSRDRSFAKSIRNGEGTFFPRGKAGEVNFEDYKVKVF